MKRLLALLLCLVLALSLIPAAAAEDIEIVGVDETEEDLITIVDPEAPEETEPEENDYGIVAEGPCGENVSWELHESGQLTISGNGLMWAYPDEAPDYAAYADQITRLYITEGVTGVGGWAFSEHYGNLTEVSFPSTLKEIGNSAFKGSGLVEVSFPAALESIVGWAFEDCASLERIAFHGPAPDLNFCCFNGVTATVLYPKEETALTWTTAKLQDYYTNHHINGEAEDISSGTLTWKQVSFCGDFAYWKINNRTLKIYGTGMVSAAADEGASMFIPMMDQFDDVYITDGKEGISAWSFAGLTNMKTCRIPAGMDRIAIGVFMNSGLTEFTFPDAPRLVMENLFRYCSSLKTVRYLGDPCGCGWGSYTGVTATIYYPADNPNWSEELIQTFYTDYHIVEDGPDGLTWVAISNPTITTQPSNKTAYLGSTVKFTVKAAGGGLSYQWYYRHGTSGEWKKCSSTGNKTATLTLTATEARNGFNFCCRVSNPAGHKYTRAVSLTVTTKPVVTTQPKDKTVNEGSTAKFTVAATGAESYQWQYRKSASDSWHNSTGTGNKTATLTLTATEARNGFQFRCKITNEAGTTYTQIVTLTVK